MAWSSQHAFPVKLYDDLPIDQRIEEGSPMPMAFIGGRPVYLARPDRRGMPAGTPRTTVPITTSRLRLAYDEEAGRLPTGPFQSSAVESFPLAGVEPDPAWAPFVVGGTCVAALVALAFVQGGR